MESESPEKPLELLSQEVEPLEGPGPGRVASGLCVRRGRWAGQGAWWPREKRSGDLAPSVGAPGAVPSVEIIAGAGLGHQDFGVEAAWHLAAAAWTQAAGRVGARAMGHRCRWAPKGMADAAGQAHRRARGVRERPRPRWASLAGWKGGQVCRHGPQPEPGSHGALGACRLPPGSVASSGRGPPLPRCGLAAGLRAVLVLDWPAPSPGAAPLTPAGTLPARSPRVTGQGHTSQALAGCDPWEAGRLPCVSACRPARSSLLRAACFWTVPVSPLRAAERSCSRLTGMERLSWPRWSWKALISYGSLSRGQPGSPRTGGRQPSPWARTGGRQIVALGE